MKRIRPWQIVAFGWITFLIYAYPGLFTRDSYDQLKEARSGIFYDAHPPMMQAIWRVLDYFVAGPFALIMLQTLTFVVGAYALFRRALCPRGSAIAAGALLWFPPVGAVMAVAWKDCLMAGFLMLGIAGLFDERRRVRIAALVALMIATGVRYNAFGATLAPIVLLFTWSESKPLKRYAIAFAVWLATTFAAFGANALLTDRPTHYWHASLGISDIVGTLNFVPKDIEDRKLRRALADTPLVIEHDIHAHIRAHYEPDGHVWIVSGPHRMFDMSLVESAPPAQRVAVEQAWRTIVFAHSVAYLRHRIEVFRCVLGLTGKSWDNKLIVTHDYQSKDELRELGLPTGYSWFQAVVGDIYDWCSTTWLFRPYVYLILGLCLMRLRRERDVIAIVLSGITVEASLFFIGPSSDYRYSHWMVVTTCIALVLAIARRYREGRTP